jgi:predicted nucleic acid-binding protein
MTNFVLDSSIAVKWFFVDEPGVDRAREVLEQLTQFPDRFLVPDLFFVELAAVCLRKCNYDSSFADRSLAAVRSLGIRTVPVVSSLLNSGMTLSCKLRHSLYDCIFLALALETDSLWLTADDKALGKLGGHSKNARSLYGFAGR